MDPVWLLLLLPCAAAGGWLMAKRERARARKLPAAYFKGLNFLLNEQPDKALQVFLKATEMDGETVEIHLALGNLFRRRGEIERATRIHQNLIARADLDEEFRLLALFELAQDYFKSGLLDRAENLFQELRESKEHNEQANRFLLQIYEQEKEWRSALGIGEQLARRGADTANALAQYCCELAEQAITEGRFTRAQTHLDEALRHDAHCVRAVIQCGRLASMRGNHNNAIAIWRQLEQWSPQSLGEVVEHLANSYAALGDTENYREFLRTALKKNPDLRIITALVALAEREQHGAGRALLLELVRNYPSIEGLCELVNARARDECGAHRCGGGAVKSDAVDKVDGAAASDVTNNVASDSASNDASNIARHTAVHNAMRTASDATNNVKSERKDFALLAELLAEVARRERGYCCRTCGFCSSALHWQCPGCKGWGTVQKRVSVTGKMSHSA